MHDSVHLQVSFLEIYNEELIDLLQQGDRMSLRIYEHTSGTAATRGLPVKNLTEWPVTSLPVSGCIEWLCMTQLLWLGSIPDTLSSN